MVNNFAKRPGRSAVLAADAVVVLATEHEGRGMFVELGAALAGAKEGQLRSIAVVGEQLPCSWLVERGRA